MLRKQDDINQVLGYDYTDVLEISVLLSYFELFIIML